VLIIQVRTPNAYVSETARGKKFKFLPLFRVLLKICYHWFVELKRWFPDPNKIFC